MAAIQLTSAPRKPLHATRRINGSAIEIAIPEGAIHAALIDAPRGFDDREADVLVLTSALIAGQASLEPHLVVDAALRHDAVGAAEALGGLLYDAHAYTQRLERWRHPRVDARVNHERSAAANGSASRAVLLWSGGKDALAALEVLRANGFTVIGVHATANLRVAALEAKAAAVLAERHQLPLWTLEVDIHAIDARLRRASSASHRFPLSNDIPHGRDLLLAAAAGALARMTGAAYVTAGYERDLWTKTIAYRGRLVYRHDSQSARAGRLIDRLLRTELGVGFFSPIAAFSERTILRHLLHDGRDEFSYIASCFWTRWCGSCAKCLRYGMAQALAGTHAIDFQLDPLRDANPALRALVDSLKDPDIPFWHEQVHAIFALYDAGLLAGLPETNGRLRTLRPLLDSQLVDLDSWLNAVEADDLAPHNFTWHLDNSTATPTPNKRGTR